jgi:hypothetical protein
MSRGATPKSARARLVSDTFAPGSFPVPRKGEKEVTYTSTAASVEPTDQPALDAAAFTGKIELFDGDDGRVDVDALVSFAVATEMFRVAAAEGLAGLQMLQADEGGPTLFTGQVPSDVLAAVLAPAERAGAKIVDSRGVIE